MSSALKNLFYRKFRVSFIVTHPFSVQDSPYVLIRGIFGMILRKEVCMDLSFKDCSLCNHYGNCPYTSVFKIKLAPSHPLFGLYTDPPVPYIIYPNIGDGNKLEPDSTFSIELTLIGKAIEYDTFLLQVLQKLSGGDGRLYNKFECSGIETMIGDDKKSHMRFSTQPDDTIRLKLRFNSPVLLESNKNPITNLPLSILMERLTERLALLSYLYCGGDLPDPKTFKSEITTDDNIDSFYPVHVKMTDGGSNKTIEKQGLLGSVAYRGELGAFMPIIRAGEVMHVGRFASYGLGKYTIEDQFIE